MIISCSFCSSISVNSFQSKFGSSVLPDLYFCKKCFLDQCISFHIFSISFFEWYHFIAVVLNS